MAMANYLQGGSGISLQGGSTNTVQNTSSPQKTTTAQQLQPTVNPQPQYTPTVTLGAVAPGPQTTPTYTQPAPDPYARWGGASAYNKLVSGFGNQKNAIGDSASDAARASGINMRNSIMDLIESLQQAQQSVDNRGINNEMAKRRGYSDIYSMMNRGIKSGGVMLANRNASNSSAAQAIADAYGQVGQRELSDVNNQFELENQDIGIAQDNVDLQRRAGLRRIDSSKELTVNNIVSDANNQLAALDTAMANASLPDRIAIDQEKNRIRSEVLNILSQYDNKLGDVNNVKAMGRNARIGEATRRMQLGQASPTQFDYQTEAPAQFQNTGPFASSLPIFTYRGDREEN